MKKGIFVAVCFALFLTFRLLPIRHNHAETIEKTKPYLPEPVMVKKDPLALLPLARDCETARCYFDSLLSHPWIQSQPQVRELNIEMVRDLSTLEEISHEISEDITNVCIQALIQLQNEIPFNLPKDKYNVLCIPQATVKAPASYSIFQRLYLGESEVGLPFYLDVRVFELENCSADEIISWHLQALDGEVLSLGESVYISKGYPTRETAHGFAKSMRGQYVAFFEKEGQLFVLHAEAHLKTFQKHELLLRQL